MRERERMQGSTGGPKAFWEREQGSATRSVAPSAPAPGRPLTAPARSPSTAFSVHPPAPVPIGPPARVGGTVAALVVALLTLTGPILGAYLGLWFLLLGSNVPGITLAIVALTRIPDAPEVERFLRYTWACNFAYIGLNAVLAVFVLLMLAMIILLGY
ncbi:hypothetical protein [Nocardiopsis lambiniae]|uniref:Uncharacterized protein n=1 Tax=Nocardiopsis lambiniae TaxID=3075539 RepID=A0ABU2M8D6_9ACTN|nr:hypothetical protein [Nocardiopsis sp. DSM 44743]MDT0328928.1 hypothetical protein [Nocardiopsis sp. DSM 44743]